MITGGNSGLGLETAKALASRGCRVLVCALNAKAGAADVARDFSAEAMKEYSYSDGPAAPDVKLLQLDLADFASIQQCAAQVQTGVRCCTRASVS
jgi:NAD(P)-dependent dehydrogenase (short-subunit alcohol dehydrogenase family)